MNKSGSQPPGDGASELVDITEGSDSGLDGIELSVGDHLKKARLEAEISLEDVSKTLRIQLEYLAALEEGRYSDLPGATYALGFIRSYANLLSLDESQITQKFKSEFSLQKTGLPLDFPAPSKEGRAPKPWLILLVLVLAGLAYGGWYYSSTGDTTHAELVTDLSSRVMETNDLSSNENDISPKLQANSRIEIENSQKSSNVGNEESKVDIIENSSSNSEINNGSILESSLDLNDSNTDEQVNEVESSRTIPLESENNDFNVSTLNESVSLWNESEVESSIGKIKETEILSSAGIENEETTSQPMENLSPKDNILQENEIVPSDINNRENLTIPQVYGQSNSDSRITLTARSDSWLQVQGPDNELLITRILRAGDSYRVPNREGLSMITGNAGALIINVDNIEVQPIGPVGAVRRDVPLNPDQLKAGINLSQ